MYLRIDCRKKLLNSRGCSLIQYAVQTRLFQPSEAKSDDSELEFSEVEDSQELYLQRKFDSQNGPFEPERSFTGIKFQAVCRRRMYTHRKFDSQNGPFEPESNFTGIKSQEVW